MNWPCFPRRRRRLDPEINNKELDAFLPNFQECRAIVMPIAIFVFLTSPDGHRGLASDILLNSDCENKSCLLIENMVATVMFTKKTPVPVRASLSRAINIVNCVRGRFIRAG
jgi:hypothetical protein